MKKKNIKKTAIIVFLKAPVKGFVKTRLAEKIGDDASLEIYKHFVRQTLDMLTQTDHTVHAYFYPIHNKKYIIELLGDRIPLFPQRGSHLGERMGNAMEDAFSKGFDKVLLIGTDIPELTTEIINDAVINLDKYQAVIGPSTDGGYYLIGFHQAGFTPDIFIDMPWGESSVLKKTLSVFKSRNMPAFMLKPCRDIDTYEDLHAFLSEENIQKDTYKNLLNGIKPGVLR